MVVDEYQNTSRKGIYALGDVCGKALLTPGTAAVPPSLRSPLVPHGAVAQLPVPPCSGHRSRQEAGPQAL